MLSLVAVTNRDEFADTATAPSGHDGEPHSGAVGSKLNWLRAGVLGANDGLLSTAGLVIGVAATAATPGAIVVAGVAGLSAGASAMALGEYVSVSTQRDTEKAWIAKEQRELLEQPEEEFDELVGLFASAEVERFTFAKAAGDPGKPVDHYSFARSPEIIGERIAAWVTGRVGEGARP